jgi:hypothetical protein
VIHITAVDAIGVAAETRTASIDIITIARTDTETDHARTNENMDTRGIATATIRKTTAVRSDTAKGIAADRPDAIRGKKRN